MVSLKLTVSFGCLLALAYRAQANLVMFGDSLSDDGRGANPVQIFQLAELCVSCHCSHGAAQICCPDLPRDLES